MTDCYWEYPLTYVHDFSIGNSVSWLPLFTVWNDEKSSHLNDYNTANMQDISKIPFDHSQKILAIQQG